MAADTDRKELRELNQRIKQMKEELARLKLERDALRKKLNKNAESK